MRVQSRSNAVRLRRLLEAAEVDATAGKASEDAVDAGRGRCQVVEPGDHECVTAADEIQRAFKGVASARERAASLMRKHLRAAGVTQRPELKLKRLAAAAISCISDEHGTQLRSADGGSEYGIIRSVPAASSRSEPLQRVREGAANRPPQGGAHRVT